MFVFIFILLIAGFFDFRESLAEENSKNFITTEIMHSPEKNKGDWIEMYVLEDAKCNIRASDRQIKDFYLCTKIDFSNSCIQPWPVYSTIDGCYFKKGSYLILTNQPDDFKNSENFIVLKLSSSFNLLSNKDAFIAYSDNGKETWKEAVKYGEFLNKNKGYSLEKIDFDKNNSGDNWQESCIDGGTPGKENSICEEEEEEEPPPIPKDYSGKVKINEIKAETSDEEVVEIISSSDDDIDFDAWCIKDEVKYKKTSWDCKKPSRVEKNKNFYALYGSFSLNNDSGGDSVFLYDENKNLVDSVSYKNAKSKYTFAFDGQKWRWTSQATPGQENLFDKILSGKIKLPEKVYKNIYAYFSVSADKDAEKFTWDFGDNHKSYLKETKHKYAATGQYRGSLKITGNGEDAFYEFNVEVKKYSAPKIRIIALSPNPAGSDTENEWLEIANQSDNEVNLKGWSIATGWKNLYNHPIRENFEIKKGKTKKLERDICAFTLANTQTKIELRSPDGKIVQKIKYDRQENKIEEDEIYEKNEDGWEWLAPENETLENDSINPPLPLAGEGAQGAGEGNVLGQEDIKLFLGKMSDNPAWLEKKEIRFVLLDGMSKIKIPEEILTSQPRVLGIYILPSNNNYYFFTHIQNEKYWLVSWTENVWIKMNFGLNQILNKI